MRQGGTPWIPIAALALKASAVDIANKKQRADIPHGRSALWRANGRTVKFKGDSYIKFSLNSDYKNKLTVKLLCSPDANLPFRVNLSFSFAWNIV
jgi:hypothetical protein